MDVSFIHIREEATTWPWCSLSEGWEEKEKRRTGKDTDYSHNSELYDVDAHVSQQSQLKACLEELGLSKEEEKTLNTGKWLNDTLIDAGQKLLQ